MSEVEWRPRGGGHRRRRIEQDGLDPALAAGALIGSMGTSPSRNFLLVPILAGLWAALVLTRLVQLQVFEYEFLTRQARRQQERTIEVSPVRGVIYDRNLHPLAISVEVDSVFAVPGEIADPQAASKLLAPVLQLDEKDIRARLGRSRIFTWIKRKVSAQEAARVRQLNLKGIYFQKESKRFYPKRELAAHVLGHVGLDDQGLAGIELRFDGAIQGRPGQLLIERDARQRWFRRTGHPPVPGQSMTLTLDETIQYIAERELSAVMLASRARSGSVVVEDPFTGEILALANQPTFNPNRYAEADPDALRNLAIGAAYEPGSTFKVVTMAAALEEKLANPEERIDCQMGAISVAGHIIHDHMRFGLLTVSEILQKSSDVGAIKLAMRVGNQDLYRYLRSFGFGAPTGIELPGEASGLTKPPERWSKISIGAIAMGQEIGVTPLQLTTAASAVANGGWLVRPYIIHEVPPTGAARLRERPPGKRVLSPETAAMLQEMMTLVVNAGTARAARPEGYTAAGKTGTAQKIDPATGTYSRTDFVASFVGFVPAEEPRFTILVVLDSPRGRYHGGDIAAPVFKRIAEQALAYRNVPPLDSGQPNLIPASAKQPLQFASMDDVVDTNVAAFQDEGSGDAVPSFLGKTVRGATEESLAKDVPVELLGSGIAYRQFPLPGSPRPGGQKVLIWFRVGSAVEAQPAAQNTPSPKGPKNPAGPVVGVSPAAGGAATG